MMIFDTDVLIFFQRGNSKAGHIIESAESRAVSIITYMELLQQAKNKSQMHLIRDFLKKFNFAILPINENISHRASIYVEEYSLSSGLHLADALIAATTTENNLELVSANAKHYKIIRDLSLKVFKP